MRANGFKLCRGGSGWILGRTTSSKEESSTKQAAQGVVESASMKVLQNHGDVALRDIVSGHGGGGLMVGLDDLCDLSNLNDSVIS